MKKTPADPNNVKTWLFPKRPITDPLYNWLIKGAKKRPQSKRTVTPES